MSVPKYCTVEDTDTDHPTPKFNVRPSKPKRKRRSKFTPPLLKCKECKYTSKNSGHFLIHQRIHTGEKPFHCKFCDRAFADKGNMQKHEGTHSSERPFQCDQCDQAFGSKRVLNIHLLQHTGEKPFVCNICDKSFRQGAHLRTHKKLVHSNSEKHFRCTMCDYAGSRNGDLKMHLRRHSDERPYKCGQCSFSSRYDSNLKIHQSKHATERPFKCPDCTLRFKTKRQLNVHIPLHTTEKRFTCDLCDYASKSKRCLAEHFKRKKHLMNINGQKITNSRRRHHSKVVGRRSPSPQPALKKRNNCKPCLVNVQRLTKEQILPHLPKRKMKGNQIKSEINSPMGPEFFNEKQETSTIETSDIEAELNGVLQNEIKLEFDDLDVESELYLVKEEPAEFPELDTWNLHIDEHTVVEEEINIGVNKELTEIKEEILNENILFRI